MGAFKFIRYSNNRVGNDIVIFSDMTQHSDMFRMVRGEICHSAGFVTFGEKGPHFYGESESLRMKSDSIKDRQRWSTLNYGYDIDA